MQKLPTRISQQLLRQLFAATCSCHRGFGEAHHSFGLIWMANHHVETADYDSQQIVEVVGNASRELPYRLHLLGLTQGIFCLPTLRNIHDDPGHSDRSTFGVFHSTLDDDPPHCPVVAADPTIEVKRATLGCLLERLIDRPAVLLKDMIQQDRATWRVHRGCVTKYAVVLR